MTTIHARIRGTAPLLQNKFSLEAVENASKAKKRIYVPEIEAEKLCYRDENGRLVHPTEHIYASMIGAGVDFKFSGRKTYKDVVKAGVILSPEYVPINDSGKEVKEYIIDTRRVVIQRASVAKWRPRYEQWELEFNIEIIDEENIDEKVLKEILERAGRFRGLGDYRPRFGRFQVTKWDCIPNK